MSVRLHARDLGDGMPLVLLHAFPLSSTMWLAQRAALAARFRVITPDLRGFGGSVLGDEEPSIEAMADDVARLMRLAGAGQAAVGGLSLGGHVAMALCRRHPELVLGLVLADTTASADTPAERLDRMRMAEALEAENTTRVLVDEVLPGLLGPTTLQQRALVHGRVRGLVQSAPVRAAAWALRAMADRPDSFETLGGLRVPALVLVGAEDTLTPEDDARAMVEVMPNSELEVIARAGHLSAVEQPDLFNQAVQEFVGALARSGGRSRNAAS